MKLVLDTSAYCLCDRANPSALEAVEEARALFLPVVAYGELYYGFKYGNRFSENVRRLDWFLREYAVGLIEVTIDVAVKFGDIYAALRKKGRIIPANDLWISACCMDVGGTLLTSDRHFAEVEQIQSRIIDE